MSLPFGAGSDKSAASYQNIEYEVIKHNHYENMVEIVNMSQMLNVLWKCAL